MAGFGIDFATVNSIISPLTLQVPLIFTNLET
jgi:hypothetical protein